MNRWVLPLWVCALAWGCGDDGSAGGGEKEDEKTEEDEDEKTEEDEEEEEDEDEDGDEEQEPADDSGSGGEWGDEDSGGDPVDEDDVDEGQFASGIHIEHVEINQGVGIPLYNGGAVIEADGRNAPVISDRRGLVRIFWRRDEDFEVRPIEARLTLIQPSGHRERLSLVGEIDRDPSWYHVQGTFFFKLAAHDIRAGTKIVAGFFEVDDDYIDGDDPASPPRVPEKGELDLGAWGDPMELKVVLVPVKAPCSDTGMMGPIWSDEIYEHYRHYYYNNNPVQELFMEVLETQTITYCPYACDTGLARRMATSLGVAPNVYVQGLFGEAFAEGAGGCGFRNEPVMNADRTSNVHSFHSNGRSGDMGVHELGHSQNRPHTWDTDDYPYANNALATHGYGPFPGLHPYEGEMNEIVPQNQYYDYMSYDYPYWAQDFTYAKIAERIRILTSWDYGEGPVGEREEFEASRKEETLVAIIPVEGEPAWYSYAGTPTKLPRSASDPQNRAVYHRDGQAVGHAPIAVTPGEDTDAIKVEFPLPDALATQTIELHVDGKHYSVDISKVRRQQDFVYRGEVGLPGWARGEE